MAAQHAEILLIEDDLGDSDLTREIFQKDSRNNRLTVIEDGAEAMKYFFGQVKVNGARRPDLVILDLNLPKIDGRELLRELKSDEELRDIPVVVFTTSNAQADISLCYSLGANCYVSKPHEYQEFENAVGVIRDFWLRFGSLPSETDSKAHGTGPADQGGARTLNLLVVSKDSHEPSSSDDFRQKARTLGLAVACREAPEDAIKVLEKDEFDLVLLDADGLDHWDEIMLDRIRARARQAPIVVFHHARAGDSKGGVSVWQFMLKAWGKGRADLPPRRSIELLDELVKQRTTDLLDVNKRLQEAVVARSAAETAARRSEARYHKLANSTFEGIVVHEGENIVDCNLSFANFFQLQVAELLGRNILELIQDNERGFFQSKIKSDDESPFESYGIRRDGEKLQLEFQSKWLDDGERKYRITACRDFKERRALEQLRVRHSALIKVNRELEQFASIASHDLKEPIRTIESYLYLLRNELQNQCSLQAKKYMDIAIKCSGRMKTLTNDLLSFSRIAGAEFTLVPVDLQDALDLALENLQEAVRESGAVIEHEVLPLVQGDKSQLTQLFQNLLSNAIKFRKPGETPRIQIRSKRLDGAWQISVQDNGIGFEPKHAQNIFLMFQRLHSHDQYSGSGLGLAICFKIMENHQGRIWADSSPGQGSTFHLTLQPAILENLAGRRILIVDDSEDVRALFEHLLTARGAQVVTAENGEDALTKVSSEAGFDIIIMDIEMPKMSGTEATAALRKKGFARTIIAFTGHTRKWAESDYKPLGFDGYICKDNAIVALPDYCLRILNGREPSLPNRACLSPAGSTI
ncbi:MAG TPA: response regulator [Oligoflexus sp.]|uniref:response regulator n=1 Tax=Oligoflexus sp. TaxID=1971216 RepID=UPI002D7F2501|nr:response regulator [Oligoflexus sp.]HET9240346.1 response regulator [Oligoflexus sp.]